MANEQDAFAKRALELDNADPLAHLRERFLLNNDVIYLDGNSLGPPPASIVSRLSQVIEREWAEGLITSWEHWSELPLRAAARLSPLLGARKEEVAIADSTSVNLYKAIFEASQLRPERRRLVIDGANFPSDLYVARAAFEHAHRNVSPEIVVVPPGRPLEEQLDEQVAVLTFTHVDFRSGAMHDLVGLVEAAHRVGALVVVDLCHSTGAMPLRFDDEEVDFAVGCGYKFLNGGPGAPGYLAVAARHHELVTSPIPGWWGSEHPFAMEAAYVPAPGIARQQVGTPGILGLSALDAALEAFDGVDLVALRDKAIAMTSLFIQAVEESSKSGALELVSPRDQSRRGAQVSFSHPRAQAVMSELRHLGVLGDFRPPSICRFGFPPLLLSYSQAVTAAHHLASVGDRFAS